MLEWGASVGYFTVSFQKFCTLLIKALCMPGGVRLPWSSISSNCFVHDVGRRPKAGGVRLPCFLLSPFNNFVLYLVRRRST